MIYLVVTAGLILLLVLGFPIGVALGIIGFSGYMLNIGPVMAWVNAGILPQKMSYSLMNFLLISIPLFIFAAKIMNGSGITKRIFSFANTVVGFLPGGLGHANVVSSLIFSGMSGAAVSDASGLGQIEIEAMTSHGYDPDFSAAVTASSSTIGPIFPPSVPMVVFSTISGVSVGKLFLGGVIPGLLMTAAIMVMIVIYAMKRGYERLPVPTPGEVVLAFGKALLPMLTPVILLIGIWTGVFTPTEAAAVAALYALIVSAGVYRDLSFSGLFQLLKDTARETANIGFVIAAAAFYGWVLARSGMTMFLAEWIGSVATSPLAFLFLVNIFFLIVGCFLEAIAAILVFGPILYPVSVTLGIDPVQFGVIMVLNLMIGLLTPPFGIVLFIVRDLAKITFRQMIRATIPFLVPLFAVLILMNLFPGIVTWLPGMLK